MRTESIQRRNSRSTSSAGMTMLIIGTVPAVTREILKAKRCLGRNYVDSCANYLSCPDGRYISCVICSETSPIRKMVTDALSKKIVANDRRP